MLQNLLATCGFNTTEQKVLIYLIKNKQSIASLIAKKVGLKRTTVYAALDGLVHNGVIGKSIKSKVTYFMMSSPKVFTKILLEQARMKFEETATATKLLEEELRVEKIEMEYGVFQVSSFESVEAVYAQLEDAILGGDFCAIFNPQIAISGSFKSLVSEFLKKTAKTKPYIREILVAGPEADWYLTQVKNPNHQVRLIEKDKKIVSDVILNKGAVILNHYDHKQESSIKITEKNFYTTMMTVFDELWESPQVKAVL